MNEIVHFFQSSISLFSNILDSWIHFIDMKGWRGRSWVYEIEWQADVGF